MQELQKFTIKSEDATQRVDLFLSKKIVGYSRSACKRVIEAKGLMVNGVVQTQAQYKVRAGDTIVFDQSVISNDTLQLKPQNIELDIVYEDEHLLVVNKPSGMVVHPAAGNSQDTLMNAVMYRYSELQTVGDSIRSGLIHRLDKDTSGLVMISKTTEALWFYSKAFAERNIQKTYLMVVAGDATKIIGKKRKIVNYLGRNPQNRKKITVLADKKGKLAETDFFNLGVFQLDGKTCSLVKAIPKTGRTHQLRVQLSSLGLPILGDNIYGRGNKFARLMLHAWRLSFKLLDGKDIELQAKLPDIFTVANAKEIKTEADQLQKSNRSSK